MKALSLFSGGLDSILSVKVVQEQGIEVLALHFDTGFGGKYWEKKKEYLYRISKNYDIPLRIVDIKEHYLEDVLFSPKYGYGSAFNPCIDCHGYMFFNAASLMKEYGGDFLISGEVKGQRPMSQRAEALKQVEELSGVQGLVLRPLSAKLLPITIPEENGWIDREKLLDIQGRSRTRQLAMVKEYGFTEFESPAGGCLLTEGSFANKIKDFIDHEKMVVGDIDFLKFGRHMRLPDNGKFIIGKNKEENDKLSSLDYKEKYHIVKALEELPGPICLLTKGSSERDKHLAMEILLSYTKVEIGESYPVFIDDQEFNVELLKDKAEYKNFLIT